MNRFSQLTAVIEKPFLLEVMVEKLAQRHRRPNFNETFDFRDWRGIAISSVETFMEGNVAFSEAGATCRQGFTTPFLFGCSKEKGSRYKLTWSASLS